MSIEQAYYALRNEIAHKKKKERLGEKPTFGAPSDRDYLLAAHRINNMPTTELLKALARHEEPPHD